MVKNDRPIEYKMTKQMFNAILETRGDSKENPYTYVMGVLNEQYGLRGTVKKILIHND